VSDVNLSIKGIQEAQAANLKAIAAVKPTGAVGQAVKEGAALAHRYAVYFTPWEHGALRAAHAIRLEARGLRGRIYISPSAVAPRRKARPSEYGVYLHAQGRRSGLRGGIRAFYEHTWDVKGDEVLHKMAAIIKRGLP
jgi:hypothetical protein